MSHKFTSDERLQIQAAIDSSAGLARDSEIGR